MRIGVFALQGAFIEHETAMRRLGVDVTEIRKRADFSEELDGLILPGGESTVQGKLLREEGLMEPLRDAIAKGMPVFGTCAGLILLAKRLVNDPIVHLGAMDIAVRRNAYGRQLGSFRAEIEVEGVGSYPAVFIRAPYIEEVGEKGQALAFVDGHIVAARQGNMLATAFHPELTDDLRVHEYFLGMIRAKNRHE